MALNPVISMLGRRLRLAVIGGGPGSFIGAMHRQAARLDDRYEIVTGVLSSDPERSKKAGLELGIGSRSHLSNCSGNARCRSLHAKMAWMWSPS